MNKPEVSLFEKTRQRAQAAMENPEGEIVRLGFEIDTLRFQLEQVAGVLSCTDDSSFARFVVQWNLSKDELDRLHDIFEAQEKVMKVKTVLEAEANWDVFSKAIVDALPGRKGLAVSEVIWPFYHGGYWLAVCVGWREWIATKREEKKNAGTG